MTQQTHKQIHTNVVNFARKKIKNNIFSRLTLTDPLISTRLPQLRRSSLSIISLLTNIFTFEGAEHGMTHPHLTERMPRSQ